MIKGFEMKCQVNELIPEGTAIIMMHPNDFEKYKKQLLLNDDNLYKE